MSNNSQRVVQLIDGVFAIVMTLLVLDFKIPKIEEAKVATMLLPKLWMLWPKFITYITSCVVLGIFWVYHHNQFRFIQRVDRNLLWINILFIIAVAFVPFSAALISEYSGQKEAIIIYGINLISIGYILYLHWRYATHRFRLVNKDLSNEIVNRVNNKLLGANIFYIAAVLISFITPTLSLIIYVLVPLYHIRPAKFDNYSSN